MPSEANGDNSSDNIARHAAGGAVGGVVGGAIAGNAGIGAGELDYLIGCTLSPDYQVPGIAPLVQCQLDGCPLIPAIDLRAGCAAILYALQMGRALIESQAARKVVCFGAEAQSKALDLSPASAELSMLFGDGAGALVLSDRPAAIVTQIEAGALAKLRQPPVLERLRG